MQYDRQDVQVTTTVKSSELTISLQHKPTGTVVKRTFTIDHRLEADDTIARNSDLMHSLLRDAIGNHLQPGQPDRLVRITAEGVRDRIPWAKTGWLFVVHFTTPGPRGEIVHVKDSAGHAWTLGVGDYVAVNEFGFDLTTHFAGSITMPEGFTYGAAGGASIPSTGGNAG
jgi:hypothetical protein